MSSKDAPPQGPRTSELSDREVVRAFEDAGQGHVFRFLPDLRRDDAAALLADARSVDLAQLARLAASSECAAAPAAIEPLGEELVRIGDHDDARRLRNAAHDRGQAEIREGRVAVVIAAGGQGTRMGSAVPKALWPVGPRSGKPLLQWHFEKILFWARKLGRPVPVALLVSDATAQITEDFVRWHSFFGVDPTWVRFARQRSLPAVDAEGRILLAAKHRIALAPNGHGGTFAALRDAKLLDLWHDHGVRTISYCQIDNPLVRTLDPVFVGFHTRHESEFSSKSVAKRSPAERVGVFARCGGRACVVEYSELRPEQASAVDQSGELMFGQGSIAAHAIDLGFARSVAREGLPFHRASKRVAHVDAHGRLVSPEGANAVKFETFLFDALPRAHRTLVLETRRSDEFSPIKNAEGEDSPETARRDLIELFRGWMRRAGRDAPPGSLEFSPLEAPDEHAYRASLGLPWK
ncbi:MAG: putative uridylyltransferase [Planctomycetes bacterium]|nr:putative uridylyltransferase [Planctomycetota bacterium]